MLLAVLGEAQLLPSPRGCPPLPEAPAAVGGAVRALPHRDHLPRAESFPQEHREGALDVQDGGGPLPGTPGAA